MNVREEEARRKGSSTSRGLGLAAAAIGVGVGAALYYMFSKREERPDSEGATSQNWTTEPLAIETEIYSTPISDYTTISAHTTTDTSVHDSEQDISHQETKMYNGLGRLYKNLVTITDSDNSDEEQIMEYSGMEWPSNVVKKLFTSNDNTDSIQKVGNTYRIIIVPDDDLISSTSDEEEEEIIEISDSESNHSVSSEEDNIDSESEESLSNDTAEESIDNESGESILEESSDEESDAESDFHNSIFDSISNDSFSTYNMDENDWSNLNTSNEINGELGDGNQTNSVDLNDTDLNIQWDVTNSSAEIPLEPIPYYNAIISRVRNLISLSPGVPTITREEQQARTRRERAFRERKWSLEECAICFEVMLRDQPLMALPCTHNFHIACIGPWVEERHTCPVCRKSTE